MKRIDPTALRELARQQGTQPKTPSRFLAEAIETYHVIMAEALEHVIEQEQELVEAQQAAEVLGNRLASIEIENATLRELLERWAVWTPVASDDQGSFCALCGGAEDPTESPDPFKHTEHCPVRPTRAFLAEHPQEASKGE